MRSQMHDFSSCALKNENYAGNVNHYQNKQSYYHVIVIHDALQKLLAVVKGGLLDAIHLVQPKLELEV